MMEENGFEDRVKVIWALKQPIQAVQWIKYKILVEDLRQSISSI